MHVRTHAVRKLCVCAYTDTRSLQKKKFKKNSLLKISRLLSTLPRGLSLCDSEVLKFTTDFTTDHRLYYTTPAIAEDLEAFVHRAYKS
jgi:hypothetical protein